MLLTFLSAVLFYLSFPNWISIHGFWICIWFFAVPLLLAMQGKPLRSRLGYAIFWGLCAYGLVAQGVAAISPAGFCALVLAASTQIVIFALLGTSTKTPLGDIFYFPCIWTFSEWARNGLLGGCSFYISHAHGFCPTMLGWYGVLGCLGMSFIIFLANSLLYAAVVFKGQRSIWIAVTAMVFGAVVIAGVLQGRDDAPSGRSLRICVIQANISPREKASLELFDHMAALHLQLTRQAFVQAHPDLVIWPETAFPDDLLQSGRWRGVIFNEARLMKADLLVGMAPIIDGKEYNSALLIDSQGQASGMYHKQALVPFSETTPLESWGIPWGRGYHFSSGGTPGILMTSLGPLPFGVVICSESAHPAMVRRLRRAGARFLVELSNDGWFTDRASYMLHAQAAVMRAVENRMWVVRCTNTGFSFAVDPKGVIHEDRNLQFGRVGYGIFDIMVPKGATK